MVASSWLSMLSENYSSNDTTLKICRQIKIKEEKISYISRNIFAYSDVSQPRKQRERFYIYLLSPNLNCPMGQIFFF